MSSQETYLIDTNIFIQSKILNTNFISAQVFGIGLSR